ncbi:cell division protein ZipA C-terminal FtsZ-binding domain-containing protein [Sedimenticola hydrogenitrophicus]|uniref:cell division protein ZipA C-terminal FtsZ-binding domain-containing protein n=1 Tax=Sedimenticola hydrogenitrophicus TaxID=2967975 RepID=UPI0021A2D617|nr:cell division protein ZipA C-terminal FtsZ-binding domain-containing protein [Sedimenticola hydrogenitrophicus]
MDADILRLILFVSGVGLILGIYFWDRHKKINARVHAIRKAQLETADSPGAATERVDPRWSETPESEGSGEPLVGPGAVAAAHDEALEADLEQLGRVVHEPYLEAEPKRRQESFSFTAEDPDEVRDELLRDGLPCLILQINVVASNGTFSGEDILRVAGDVELEHGDLNIFHRYDTTGRRPRVIFSMASMLEPGVFPLDKMDTFRTPGLVLFGQLPGPKDGLAAFADMLFTAERLAALLEGELQDETHSVLSKQTIEHIRGRILEHRRQLQLALSKR